MNKITVIQLLNKIANGEEVPKQIKVYGMIWTYEEGFGQYKNSRFQEFIKYLGGFYEDCPIGITYQAIFNLKVEIIEEDKEIEKITKRTNKVLKRELIYKINELTDAVNELEKGK